MQAGAYQNGTWVVGVAKGGVEEGVDSLAQSMIIAPSGQIVAQALTADDELVVARCDLDWCARYQGTVFDFDRYRRPEVYGRITAQRGVDAREPDLVRPFCAVRVDPRRIVPDQPTRSHRSMTLSRRFDKMSSGEREFNLNGTPVSVRDDHPHLLAALREELDVTSPKDGCSPSGQCGCCTVLVDGKAVVSCNLGLGQDRRQVGRHAGGRRPRRAAALRRGVRRVRRPAVRVLHPRHRRCGRSRRSTRRAPTSTGRRWRRTSAPTSAAAPATSRSSTPSRPWPRARRSSRRSARPSAASGAKYEAERARPRRPRLRRRHPCARHAPRRPAPHRSRPGRRRRHRHVGGGRGRRRRRRCSRPPTSPASCASGSSTRTGRS